MAYEYQRFGEILELILSTAWRYPDELVIGENISDFFEVKVMFRVTTNCETVVDPVWHKKSNSDGNCYLSIIKFTFEFF